MKKKHHSYLEIKLKVASSFVWAGHMTAIEIAARKGRFAVSFRGWQGNILWQPSQKELRLRGIIFSKKPLNQEQ